MGISISQLPADIQWWLLRLVVVCPKHRQLSNPDTVCEPSTPASQSKCEYNNLSADERCQCAICIIPIGTPVKRARAGKAPTLQNTWVPYGHTSKKQSSPATILASTCNACSACTDYHRHAISPYGLIHDENQVGK